MKMQMFNLLLYSALNDIKKRTSQRVIKYLEVLKHEVSLPTSISNYFSLHV